MGIEEASEERGPAPPAADQEEGMDLLKGRNRRLPLRWVGKRLADRFPSGKAPVANPSEHQRCVFDEAPIPGDEVGEQSQQEDLEGQDAEGGSCHDRLNVPRAFAYGEEVQVSNQQDPTQQRLIHQEDAQKSEK